MFTATLKPFVLSDADFDRLTTFIGREIGIRLSPAKKTMLEGRLHKRLRATGTASFGEYCALLFGPLGAEEQTHMLDLVTTNTTSFFRESAHFDLLQTDLLAGLSARLGGKSLRCWSAGCSSGEEPYTLAMVLAGYGGPPPMNDFSILATDFCTTVLETAAKGVYPLNRVESIPLPLREKYLLRSKDQTNPLVRVGSTLRNKVQFRQLNFMDSHYDVPADFHLIFCRNVLIYFDKPTQESVIGKLCKHLGPGGYLFLGHSESITGMSLPLRQIRPTVFQKI